MIVQSIEEYDIPVVSPLEIRIVIDHDLSLGASSATDSTHDSTKVTSNENEIPNESEPTSVENSASLGVTGGPATSTLTSDDVTESPAEIWERRKIVALYLVTVTILFADMNLLAPNLSTIADEFGMDDDERDIKLGGLIALGFFFVGAPVSYIVGWLADSINRSPLFAATVFFGELGCFMVVFVRTYWQLYLCRVVTGISVGGAIPVIYSVLGDLYPAEQRAAIAAIVTTGTGLGMGIGQAMAGSVDSWRFPFLIVSLPGMLCSVLLLFVKDPKRGAKEAAVLGMKRRGNRDRVPPTLSESDRRMVMPAAHGNNLVSYKTRENYGAECKLFAASGSSIKKDSVAVETEQITQNSDDKTGSRKSRLVSCKSILELTTIPSVVLIILQAAPGALPFGFCATFLNDYLQEQRGMPKQEATIIMLTFGAGNAIGVILGGVVGHYTYKRDARGPPLIMGVSLILGCLPFYLLINNMDKYASTGVVAGVAVMSGIVSGYSLWHFCHYLQCYRSLSCNFLVDSVFDISTGQLVVVPVPLERSILANVCLPQLRGRANALVGIVDDLGKGLGPALVSFLIASSDRQTAFNISLIGWIIGGVLSLAIVMFVANDEESVQQQLREKIRHDNECP